MVEVERRLVMFSPVCPLCVLREVHTFLSRTAVKTWPRSPDIALMPTPSMVTYTAAGRFFFDSCCMMPCSVVQNYYKDKMEFFTT